MMVYRGLLRELNERFEEVIWDYLGMRHVVEALPDSSLRALGRRLREHYLPGNQDIALGTLSGLIDVRVTPIPGPLSHLYHLHSFRD